MLRINKKFLITLAIASIIFAALSGYVLKHKVTHYPTTIALHYAQIDSDILTVYHDIGFGFRQSEREYFPVKRKEFTSNESIQTSRLSLGLRLVRNLRFDLDVSENKKQSISLKQICLSSGENVECWSAQTLFAAFEPINNINKYSFENDLLQVETAGFDPHFSFSLPIAETHNRTSKIPEKMYVVWAVYFALALFFIPLFLLKIAFPWMLARFKNHARQGFSMRMGEMSALVAFLAIFLSGAWVIAFQAGILATSFLLLSLFIVVALPTAQGVRVQEYFVEIYDGWKKQLGSFGVVGVLAITLLTILPVSFIFGATWEQEFPHLGDHEYHAWGNRVSYDIILHHFWVTIASIIFLMMGYFLGLLRWMIPFVAVLLVSAGVWHQIPFYLVSDVQGIFARYPGGARMLSLPFVHLSYLYEWHSPLNTGRLINVMSVPIWLLILRPLIIGRLPTLSILPFIVIFFWQAEIIYLFSTTYLDIWSVIFILLALEKLIVSQVEIGDSETSRFNHTGYLSACLILGVACAFKEPAVFLIPWFWLVGWPLSMFKNKQISGLIPRLYKAVVLGFASVLPFLVYYIVRKAYGVSRYEVHGFEYFLTGEWFAEMATKIVFHFGELGTILLCLIAVLWVMVLCLPAWKAYRWMMICIFGAFASQVFLFNWDSGGMTYTGYFRFYLPAIVLFFAPVILLFSSKHILGGKYFKLALSVCLLGFVANTPLLYAETQKLKEPDSFRSFNEHYDAPIYLPIRSLIETAEKAAVLEGRNRAIHINYVTDWNQPAFVYPDLLVKYKLNMNKDLKCACSNDSPSVLAPFVYMSGLNQDIEEKTLLEIDAIPQRKSGYVERWREVNDMKNMCLLELKQTCQYYHQEQISDGTVVGAIGVGVK